MKQRIAIVLSVGAVALAGCETQPPRASSAPSAAAPSQPRPVPQPFAKPFDAAEHAPFAGRGGRVLAGQAFLRQRGGGVVTCAGNPVALYPNTAWFREYRLHIQRGGSAAGLPEGALAVMRHGRCDAQGNFRITDLPEGPWLLETIVTWSVSGRPQGGVLAKVVTTGPSQESQVLLSDVDLR